MERGFGVASWDQLFARTAGSGRSLQVRVREMIVGAVAEGLIGTEAPLPSSRTLAHTLCISRNTVLLAYQRLVDEELIETHPRSGYFVRSQAIVPLNSAVGMNAPCTGTPDWKYWLARCPSGQRHISIPQGRASVPYPFIYGQFDPSLFPTNAWRECVHRSLSVLEIRGWAADPSEGDDPYLIEQIRTRILPRRGIWVEADQIMMTLGAQQALYIFSELLIDRKVMVGVEEPGFPDARNIFSLRTSDLCPLPVDANGVIPERIPEECRIAFVTPGRHCPTGVTLSAARRQILLRLIEDRDLLVIEDDYESNDGTVAYEAPTLRAQDTTGRVLYIGSLSKMLAPGLRLAFIVGPRELIREARALRRLMLLHTPINNQRALASFLALGHFDRLVRRGFKSVSERAAVLCDALARRLPDFEWSYSHGASHVWVRGPESLDSGKFAERAAAAGVLIEPGDVFFAAEAPPRNCFRIGFSSIAADRIERGIEILTEVLGDMAPRKPLKRCGAQAEK
jgi:GntR family transcriptional regulator/MocR family aminotransferase